MNELKNHLLIFTTVLSLIIIFLLDNYLINIVPSLRISFLNPPFIFLGSSLGLLGYIGIISLSFILEKKEKYIVFLSISVIIAILISYAFKYLILRPRPNLLPLLIKSSPSFPSTHALVAFSAFFFIQKIKNKTGKIILMIIMILVSLTGFYNGVHYLSDVFAGMILGLIISYFTLKKVPFLLNKIIKNRTIKNL